MVIDSKDPASNIVKTVAEPYVSGFEGIEYEVIFNYTIDGLYKKVDQLPSNTIVLFTPVVSDSTGKFFIPRNVLSNLTKKTHARIYTLWSSLMNTGVIGGNMIDGSATAEEMVRAAMDYIIFCLTGDHRIGRFFILTFGAF